MENEEKIFLWYRLLESISPTYLRAAFMRVAPKSVRVSQVVSIFKRFWYLRAKKLYEER